MSGPLDLHATCVAWHGAGLLILGRSGSGKSGLALALMAWGCALVADDRTLVAQEAGALIASAPAILAGRIEARGIGILTAPALPRARLVLAIDLDHAETARLPPERRLPLLGLSLSLVHKPATGHFDAAILHYLRAVKDSA